MMLRAKPLSTILIHCSAAEDSTVQPVHVEDMEDTPPDDSPGDVLPEEHGSGEREPVQESSPASTYRERIAAAKFASERLKELARSLTRLCRESDPRFVQVGRDLAMVTQDVRTLTDTVRHAVSLIQNDQGKETALLKTEELVKAVFTALEEERNTINKNVDKVEDLVTQIFQCRRIKEIIDSINSLFRIVRVNIRIQCSARGLNEDMFEGVSDDLDHLSKTLHQITRQILNDIKQGAKSLAELEKSISEHINNMDQVFQLAKKVVSSAFNDIRQLMYGTETMIRSADAISKTVSQKVGEVVVGIQFHDSLNQRVEHIIHAFEDIIRLCGDDRGEVAEEHLGTSFIILDLQQRQLEQIRNEIRLVRERIESDFLAIESEVRGLGAILHDKQFREIGAQQFLGAIFSSLENTLTELNRLLTQGDGMLRQIEETASETKAIADDLLELKNNVSEIREETRVQAVNTIIMASNLGHRGKTIEVLAKEIQALSDKSSVLADDVEAIQVAVSRTVEALIAGTAGKVNHKHIDKDDLAREIHSIKYSFNEIMAVVSEITRQIEVSAGHIKTIRHALVFLNSLESHLDTVLLSINKTRTRLAPWEDRGTHDSEEIEQLIERYSMAQERMIHMFDRVDARQSEDDENDIFF